MHILPANILLPRLPAGKLTAWASIACDQYTSDPGYWDRFEAFVGDDPSTLRLMLPEARLSRAGELVPAIHATMEKYLSDGVFEEYENCGVYVERTTSEGKIRRGLVAAVDLEEYDYSAGSRSAIRATERTVAERIPPRLAVRRGSPIEMPHVMILINDPGDTVLGRFACRKPDAYSFPLYGRGGYLRGSFVSASEIRAADSALEALAKPGEPLLAVGDGNHSLATAKAAWEELKASGESERHPFARYALCEIVNIYDASLEFEPIYRLVKTDRPEELLDAFRKFALVPGELPGQSFTAVSGKGERVISSRSARFSLPVTTLQTFLDGEGKRFVSDTDYIHGEDELRSLASREGYLGFLFRGMEKGDLFSSVGRDGCLPRKTFSMGHADDKRYYMECRRI